MSEIDIFLYNITRDIISVLYITPSTITETNIDEVENETFEIVKKTISALESAIEDFDKSKKDPSAIEGKVEHYRELHLLLSDWAQELAERPENEEFSLRIERIRQFIDICQALG